MKITINTDIFAAASLFKATQDIRYYLNGLYLESGPKGARLVATDGHTMCIAQILGEYPVTSIIIPTSLAAIVKHKAKSSRVVELEFSEEVSPAGAREISLSFDGSKTIGKEIEGRFPDFQRVVPDKASGEVAQFNPDYLVRVQKASTILGNGLFFGGMAMNGLSSSFSVLRDDFVVVLVPVRCTPIMETPAWIRESMNPPAKPAKVAKVKAVAAEPEPLKEAA